MSVHTHAVINKRRFKVYASPDTLRRNSRRSKTPFSPVSHMSDLSGGSRRPRRRRHTRRGRGTPDSESGRRCVQCWGCARDGASTRSHCAAAAGVDAWVQGRV